MSKNQALKKLIQKVKEFKGCSVSVLVQSLMKDFPDVDWLPILAEAICGNFVLEITCTLPTLSKKKKIDKTFIVPMGTKIVWGKSRNDLN